MAGLTIYTIHVERYDSAAAMVEAYAARRARLMGKPKQQPAKPHLTLVAAPEPEPQPIEREPADAHVEAFREHQAQAGTLPPAAFIRRRCKELSIPVEDMTGRKRARALIAARHQLIFDIRTGYPHLTMTQIGRLFGGMDHTSVLFALKKHGYEVGDRNRLTPEKIEQIKALYAGGQSLQQIADAFGVVINTVRIHTIPEYRERQARRNKQRRAAARAKK